MPRKKISPYAQLSAALGTMHDKQKVIAPWFEQKIGLSVKVADINTDMLGTFTGDIRRTDSMINTAIKKARLAAMQEQMNLGIGSEGSFGQHPSLFFVYANTECLVFIDDTRNIVISESLITEKTNFAQISVRTSDISQDFLKRTLFPSHGLIVTTDHTDENKIIYKDINSYDDLKKAVQRCLDESLHGEVIIQTDMRAHKNPTRMHTIEQVTQKLVARIALHCPACKVPGFGKISYESGLLCSLCSMPTDKIKNKILSCVQCTFTQIVPIQKKNKFADPSECQYCNP